MDEKQIVRDGYNRIASRYLAQRPQNGEDVRLLSELVARLRKGARLLDAGCGAGVPVSRLLSNDFEVVGVDFAMEQLRLAHQLIPRAEFVCQDMTRLAFAEECFDAIVSYYALINVPREEHRQVLLDFRKVLKVSGLALLCMGAGDLPGVEGDFMGATMYWSHYGAQDNIKMIGECGFDIILSKIIVDVLNPSAAHLFVLASKRSISTSNSR